MRKKKFRLMWADIHCNGKQITPDYYFDLDKLNELGYKDKDIFEFIEEMKTIAEKVIKERLDKNDDGTIP